MSSTVDASSFARVEDRGTGGLVFTFSFETLGDTQAWGMMRPPDRLLLHALADPDIGRVVVADPYRSRMVQAFRRVSGRRRPVADPGALGMGADAYLQPMRLRVADPQDPGAVARAYRRYDRVLEAGAARAGLVKPPVVTFNPLVAAFAPLEWAGPVTFYARDDWASMPGRRSMWPVFRLAYERMRDRRTRMCAVSQPLMDRLAPTGPGLVVPNGIEPREWHGPPPREPAWLSGIARPRLVYVGVIDGRLDLDAVRSIVAAAVGSVLVVGPVIDEAMAAELAAMPGVYLSGNLDRADLVGTLRHSDVGLIPHARTPLTEAMSPLKLYEYLAAGLPVVTTDLPPIRIGHPAVELVTAEAGHGAAVRTAMRRGRLSEAERMTVLDEHAWSRRLSGVIDFVTAP